ncbi:uncharacterized protein [Ptychodera flava]|uniref:uncharacterized protein n=1 Tax=Ptychodera flava TaxID=63121 RepID=UPI00396A3DAE
MPYGTQLLEFTNLHAFSSDLCNATRQPSCVAIDTELLDWDLHGDHTYYVSIKVTNVAGLSVTATSEPYRHVVDLPSSGIVLDTLDPVEAYDKAIVEYVDIDYQTTSTAIHCRWYGFAHPYQEVSYEVAFGTLPESDDILTFTAVGSTTHHSLYGLDLNLYKKYYCTVRASTESGSVVSSSDGVIVMSVDGAITGAYIFDGIDCSSKESGINGSDQVLKSDHDSAGRLICQDDIDYQSSTSTLNSYWILPKDTVQYITHVEIAIEREDMIDQTPTWNLVRAYEKVPLDSYARLVGLTLTPGDHYRTSVKFCYPGGCFLPEHSDGVWMTSTPPISEGIEEIVYSDKTKLDFSWEHFVIMEVLNKLDSEDYMDYYEWTLTVNTGQSEHGDFLYPWQRVINPQKQDSKLTYSVTLEESLVFSECIQLGLRGHNKAGLFTTVYEDVLDCSSSIPQNIVPNIVVDAAGDSDGQGDVEDVYLETNGIWSELDVEYTLSRHKLSAVWHTLRRGDYAWKVVSDESIQKRAYRESGSELEFVTYSCDSPEVLACGHTKNNFINVPDLPLQHGGRYYICIYANQTAITDEDTEYTFPAVSECSDGVTVDWTPPEADLVWIGLKDLYYQTSTSILYIFWDNFIDVEESGMTTHHSGIRYYEYAVGTSPGAVDVQDFINVAVTDRAVSHGLHLQHSRTYYATVRGVDYVGFSAKSTSSGVTVDATPPQITQSLIDVGGGYHLSTTSLSASWERVFYDQESEIAHYEWSIGSRPGVGDVFPFTETINLQGTADELLLHEGYQYYVSVRAYNGAGLSTIASSQAIVIDTSPPNAGFVYDGAPGNSNKDIDYQSNTKSLKVYWEAFNDPHTRVTDYAWTIGTCPGCDDVLGEQHVGLNTEVEARHLNLQQGVAYYSTVTACNAAGLCTSVSSDGVIPDDSPPIAGMVFDGPNDGDLTYQASRETFAAHWYNFHDQHSKLSHYEWRVGTYPGSDDIIPTTPLHITEDVYIPKLESPLPVNVPIYSTIKAYNKAGLAVEQTSNGVIVDETAPTVIKQVTFDLIKGSFSDNSQTWRSLLEVSWQVQELESQIEKQILSVFTNHQSQLDIPSVELSGYETSYTYSNLALDDGDTYFVKMVACNSAKLCVSSQSEGVLVDSTPPTVGTYAVDTDHVADLTRHQEGWMVYQQSVDDDMPYVKLAWLGFSDIHSGISHYYATIGTEYSGRQLTPDGPFKLDHEDGESHRDEGAVQTGTVPIDRDLIPGEYIYVTMWAVNGVGMRSMEAHDTFEVVKSNEHEGILSKVRRCSSQTCQGDCTCAPQYQICHDNDALCTDVSGVNQYQQVEVIDIVDYHGSHDDREDVEYTTSKCALAAVWQPIGSGISIQRYEWSAGTKGDDPGTGLFNPAHDRIWFDVGLETYAVLLQKRGEPQQVYPLEDGINYVFYVKAWYDENTYAIFSSDGVKVLSQSPRVSSSRKVQDINSGGSTDVDYITSIDTLGVFWQGVFLDNQEDLDFYEISISTHPGGDDIRQYSLSRVEADQHEIHFTDLNLSSGVRYYSNVIAHSRSGLKTRQTSDGVLVDIENPSAGTVFDGIGLTDVDYQNSSFLLTASWYGFSDLQSYMDHYIWCVGSTPGAEDIAACRSVGIRLSHALYLDNPLNEGQLLYSKIIAVDAAGLESQPVISDGVVVDTTPPQVLQKFDFGDNVLRNPSFEDTIASNTSETMFESCKPSGTPADWQVDGKAEVHACEAGIAQDGLSLLLVRGEISQTFASFPGEKYRLSFHASHSTKSSVPVISQEGFFKVSRLHKVFKLYQYSASRKNDTVVWQEQLEYFIADENETTVDIGSFGTGAIIVDNVRIRHLKEGVPQHQYNPTKQLASGVHVTIRSVGDWHTVHANWDVVDVESPVTENLWAIGTVKGGTQLQGFTSVGRKTSGTRHDLVLAHGSLLHVTLVSRNAAELETVIYSDPLTVDLTPPDLCCARDGDDEDDIDYQDSTMLSIHWSVDDPESGVDFCEVAVGLSPGSAEIQDFTRSDELTHAKVDVSGKVQHGHKLYSTIRCHNYAKLSRKTATNGVTIVTENPSALNAVVEITMAADTHYPSRGNHQPRPDIVSLAWHGFSDLTGISYYQCKIQRSGEEVLGWTNVGDSGEHFATLFGLQLKSYEKYDILLRAVNHLDHGSDDVTAQVTIETEPPSIKSNIIAVTWLSTSELVLDWTGVFVSNSSLVYELTVGTAYASNNVVSWLETTATKMTINDVDPSREYHVVVTAINEAGLYRSTNQRIVYGESM